MNIFCIGRNYVDHIKELNNQIPTEPVIFIKPQSSIYNETNQFVIPNFTQELNYELEIVLKISKEGKNLKQIECKEYCEEITVGIDFTARDIQNKLKDKGLPWEKAKGFDNATVLGKFININSIDISLPIPFTLIKNNQIVQQSSSEYMIYSFNQIIEHISIYFRLQPGDLIFTGTPSGVGLTNKGDNFIGKLYNVELLKLNVF